ncbi:MAG TPA: 16S rRNA (adenine(1518)-N(6)/adenine(1519)-N(6))-dimethyltransferase RsmA [Candidatus Saccharimonadales bacterium]|nr:16S rRNA (adenine(1518)-N(6)/adenine(1519)-N(6))-dimethyltransferase RsmA [Candidatus Saccharimonadales bacterium]
MVEPRKSLGQHWLSDEATLEAICEAANLKKTDTVLEIGPGLGDLTRQLVKQVSKVVAVELDEKLAAALEIKIKAPNLEVVQGDILRYDLSSLPTAYKVVANIPYYLTSNLLRTLSESSNPPLEMTLLVQKEVAERICAQPGEMSLLAVSVQLYYQPKLGPVVSAELFVPPPKVDSQVVLLKKRVRPLFDNLNNRQFFRVVKAGFAGRRKKLRSSLAAGLDISKEEADRLLANTGIDGDLRAQNLSLQDWHQIYEDIGNRK